MAFGFLRASEKRGNITIVRTRDGYRKYLPLVNGFIFKKKRK